MCQSLPFLKEEIREKLAAAALNQRFVAEAPASIVLAADYRRTTSRYGERGIRYVHIEVGHITQNIYLQCGSLSLGAVAVGAFHFYHTFYHTGEVYRGTES